MQGIILINKPSGISSFRVVSRVRGIIKSQIGQKLKVGHSGTLDPLATGLLVVAIGNYTKKISQFIRNDKTYIACAKLGYVSTTGDSEGSIELFKPIVPSKQKVLLALSSLEGQMMQRPPAYSAVKVGGQRAYTLARKGLQPLISPKQITIFKNKLILYKYPLVKFETTVSSGTYIRVIIEDLGHKLDCGAYMHALQRTRVGEFKLTDAVDLKDLDYSKIITNLITLDN